jgi:hypothetical protein
MSTDYVNKCKLLFVSFNWHKNQKVLGINT